MAPYILGLPLRVIRKILQENAVFIRKVLGLSVKLRYESGPRETPGKQAKILDKGDVEALTQKVAVGSVIRYLKWA